MVLTNLKAPRMTMMATAVVLVAAIPATGQVSTQLPEVARSKVRGQAVPSKPKPATTVNLDRGPRAQWIWGRRPAGASDRFYFRRRFSAGKSTAASLIASCDNQMVLWINGKRVVAHGRWEEPVRADIGKYLVPGDNEILVEGRNAGGPAGMVLKLGLKPASGKPTWVVTDKTWEVAATRDAKTWGKVVELGAMGVGPWNNVFGRPALAGGERGVFELLPGFQVERLYTVPKDRQGSWVSLAVDGRGGLLASDQGNKGLYRITPSPIGSKEPTRVERLSLPITSAHGLLVAFGHLYLSVNGGPGSGLYRATDTNGDGEWDEVKLLKRFAGGGEHGPHALRLGPDGTSIYVVAGNHTNPPDGLTGSRIPSNWSEDLLLPRQWDARGHARGRLAPGGWIARTDRDGKTWEIVSIGYRNVYDMDFSPEGELFAYDADMEWDMGSPWYRPTRLCHATSGSEFGWRSGTGKWPTWYPDSLPAVVDTGPGSPVGVTFGTGAKFPAKYRRALYLLDWTFGTMYAIHLSPQGASYVGTKEEFLSRTPLPLTDATVGTDGALYFTVGGRGAQSELFRVTYTGTRPTTEGETPPDRFAASRKLRRQLERFHGRRQESATRFAWPYLGHPDRHIRYAARLVLEAQDVAGWQDEALSLDDPQARITAAIGLARQADKSLEPRLIKSLNELDFASLPTRVQLELLRAYSLTFIRMGRPGQATARTVLDRLDRFFPAKDGRINRDLSQLLAYLNSPTVIDKTLALMKKPSPAVEQDVSALLARNPGYGGTIARMLANHPELQKIHYAFVLRTMRYGWTLGQRKAYFTWLNAATAKAGGASYVGFLNNIRTEALANVSDAEKKALASTVVAPPPKLETLPQPKGPGHAWKLDELVAVMKNGLAGRSFANGKRTYHAARCASCHRFDGAGGATGPDLSNVAGRFSLKDLSESLVLPSKVVSDQYRASIIVTTAGKVITGRIVNDADGTLTVLTDAFDPTKIARITRGDIEQVKSSKTSLMPEKLLDKLNRDELLDLVAYLLSRGNPKDLVFAK